MAKAAWNGVCDFGSERKIPATRKDILEAAEACVCRDRQDTHGRPEDSFGDIADLWTAYLGIGREITPIDMAGYAACAGEIAAEIYGN